MNAFQKVAAIHSALGLFAACPALFAQEPAFFRTDVLRADLDGAKEVIQTKVDFGAGVASPRHSHPGDEIAYVLEGTLEYQVDGKPPVTLRVGQALFIPAGANHIARNVGEGKASELATYLVVKGRPLLVIAK